jgi:glycerol-3-phosphate acyltransferase PlsY
MNYLISSVVGYLLGSIPTAYLILKKMKDVDITTSGSGNVGAFNSFKISRSKIIGLTVLFIDFIKGVFSVLIPVWIFPADFTLPALALLFAVKSHCFNPWIEFKGGRGLATAAGGAAVIFPYLLLVWCILWVIFYLMKKDIIISNISATLFSLIIVYTTGEIAIKYAYPSPPGLPVLILVTTSVLMIIFIKHIEPLKEFIIEQKTKRVIKND